MQCPTCEHEAPVAEFGDPLRCPECGAFYEKAVQLKAKRDAIAVTPAPKSKPDLNYGGAAPTNIGTPEAIKASNRTWTTIFVLFAVIVAALSAYRWTLGASESSPQKRQAPVLSGLELAKRNTVLASLTRVEHSVMTADFSIQNLGKVPIKDIEITCRHWAPSGTEIDRNTRVIYEIVLPDEKKTFWDFNMGFVRSQVDTTKCSVTNLKF